ncbi:response regulator [Cohnella sp. GCM10020058]|uniref:response regulator n=1 Tax=Cohnella sp. GCM10020058 TaxID=3317330 RepID=UPI0036336724
MIKLLIVDDETFIVEWLAELFRGQGGFEVYVADSAEDALTILDGIRVDIVLSDMMMPVMTGIELQKQILARWPTCKMIFLSGFSDFRYIQEAMRGGGVDYILKTEGDEAILGAVDKAVKSLEQQSSMEEAMEKAKRQLHSTLPVIRREYVQLLLKGDPSACRKRAEKFAELGIRIDPDKPILLALGKIDSWNPGYFARDRALIVYALQNIAEEHLGESFPILSVSLDGDTVLWMLQPGERTTLSTLKPATYVQGTFELIQKDCERWIEHTVTFALSDETVHWEQMPVVFERLKLLLQSAYGSAKGQIWIDHAAEDGLWRPEADDDYRMKSEFGLFKHLSLYLENGQRYEYFRQLGEFMKIYEKLPLLSENTRIEIYYRLATMLLTEINHYGLYLELSKKIDLGMLAKYDQFLGWPERFACIAEVANRFFEHRESVWTGGADLTKDIVRYVERNIAGDLSLTKLSEVFGYSPNYLSKIFRSELGKGIVEYVNEERIAKATDLLGRGEWTVQVVAKATGFNSEQYFHRIFKKAMGLTPSEFRERKSPS